MLPIFKNPKFVQDSIVQVLATKSEVDDKAVSEYIEKHRGPLQFERTMMLTVFGYPPAYNPVPIPTFDFLEDKEPVVTRTLQQ
jgi:hypothetical protein